MEFYQQRLRKGVVCNYGITDRFKTSLISVDFALPLTIENATGMSLLAGVMCRGCEDFPAIDVISRYLAKNYGASFSASAVKVGEMELLTFSVRYLDNEYAIDGEDVQERILVLLEKMIFSPLLEGDGFLSEYVEQEKINLMDKITGLFNDKRIYSMVRCKELMCADEAYGIHDTGSKEAAAKFDAKSLYAFYRKMLNEAQVALIYVGKDRKNPLNRLAEKFEDRSEKFPQTLVKYDCEKAKEIIEEMDLNQSKLNLGFRLGKAAAENGAACRLFNVLYGGSATSKLFMNVRERLSLCYYCSSNIDRFKNVMFVSSGVEFSKYDDARNEIEAQLDSIVKGDFSDEELENARVYLIDSIRGLYDSQGALSTSMIAGILHDETATPEQQIEEISSVSREDIMKVAAGIQLDTVYFLKGVHNEE